MTEFLIAVNALVFLWEFASGNLPHASLSGAEYGPYLDQGQYWRIVTAAFLHGSITHILFNMLALASLGRTVEVLIGRWTMLLAYLISMVGAGISIYLFSYNDPTIGASGAIFGLFGVLIALGLRLGKRGRGLITQTLPWVVLNLVVGYLTPGVSLSAHIGGLITGFIIGLFLLPVMRHHYLRDAA